MRLKKEYPDADIKSIEVFSIEGKVCVSSAFLAQYWGISDRSMQDYRSRGLPTSEYSIGVGRGALVLHNFNESIRWRLENVNQEMSAKSRGIEITKEDNAMQEEMNEQNDMARKLKADADRAETEADLAIEKLKLVRGETVNADDLDKAMAEQAVMHRTDKTNDEKILPIILENKKSSEISEILHEHNQERLDMFDKVVNRHFKCDETLYDVVEVVMQQIAGGEEHNDIIRKIR